VAGMSVGGLVSGLDTRAIVDQLMQIETNPQTLLKQQLSATQSQATAFRAINTRFDALRSAAEELTKDTAWSSVKATSSSSSVTATTAAGGSAGTVSFSVDHLARSHAVVSTQRWTATGEQTADDLPYGAGTLEVTVGGTTSTITLDRDGNGTATLAEAAAAINARKDLGLTATAVKVSDTEYRLQIGSTRTGASSTFQVGAEGAFDIVSQGRDAKITVGDAAAGYTLTSANNTFTGLVDGTTITVTAPATDVTLTVTSDPDAVADKVSSLVSAANGLLDALSSYSGSTGLLKGNNTLRQLSTQVLDVLAFTVGGDGSASKVGLELTRSGRYEFDKKTFVEKLTTDPALAQRMFTGTAATPGPDGDLATTADNGTEPAGIAAKLLALAKAASDATTGTLTTLATSTDSRAKTLQDRISAWDTRLELRRTTLTRQFTAMEVALQTMQNQGNWLSAQLASLPGTKSSSS
jgi:flagellar hook-associated protein 2